MGLRIVNVHLLVLAASCGAAMLSAQGSPAGPTRHDTSVPTPPFHHLSFNTALLSRMDDNVNRDTAHVHSVGGAVSVCARYESARSRPALVAEYDVAVHRYTATTRFNRVSQRLRSTISARLVKWWTVDLIGEGALRGSSEDRDVSDQLSIQPRFEFRLSEAHRLRLGATQRWRRFPTDTAQNAQNRYAYAEMRQRAAGGLIETQARLEQNDAAGPRFDFRRAMVSSTYTRSIGAHVAFDIGMQYRRQEYSGRLVRINAVQRHRIDHRLEPSASLGVNVGASTITLSYDPEWRRSNDPDKAINQQIVQLVVRQRW